MAEKDVPQSARHFYLQTEGKRAYWGVLSLLFPDKRVFGVLRVTTFLRKKQNKTKQRRRLSENTICRQQNHISLWSVQERSPLISFPTRQSSVSMRSKSCVADESPTSNTFS